MKKLMIIVSTILFMGSVEASAAEVFCSPNNDVNELEIESIYLNISAWFPESIFNVKYFSIDKVSENVLSYVGITDRYYFSPYRGRPGELSAVMVRQKGDSLDNWDITVKSESTRKTSILFCKFK